MNGWELVALAVVIAVAALLLLRRSRPKTAQDLLQPRASPAPVARPESGQSPEPVRGVLESLVAHRSTGTLTVVQGDETCSLYVLFGHFFHAECGPLEGSEAFHRALSWDAAVCRFDKKAALPTKETIRESTQSLLESPQNDSLPQS